jgi:hypothetical protein
LLIVADVPRSPLGLPRRRRLRRSLSSDVGSSGGCALPGQSHSSGGVPDTSGAGCSRPRSARGPLGLPRARGRVPSTSTWGTPPRGDRACPVQCSRGALPVSRRAGRRPGAARASSLLPLCTPPSRALAARRRPPRADHKLRLAQASKWAAPTRPVTRTICTAGPVQASIAAAAMTRTCTGDSERVHRDWQCHWAGTLSSSTLTYIPVWVTRSHSASVRQFESPVRERPSVKARGLDASPEEGAVSANGPRVRSRTELARVGSSFRDPACLCDSCFSCEVGLSPVSDRSGHGKGVKEVAPTMDRGPGAPSWPGATGSGAGASWPSSMPDTTDADIAGLLSGLNADSEGMAPAGAAHFRHMN